MVEGVGDGLHSFLLGGLSGLGSLLLVLLSVLTSNLLHFFESLTRFRSLEGDDLKVLMILETTRVQRLDRVISCRRSVHGLWLRSTLLWT